MDSSASSQENVINIDMKMFIGPLANIISALIIATAIIISGGIGGGTTTNTANNANTNNVAGATDTTGTGNTTTVTVSIDDDALMGNKDSAKVAIVEFSDYECPFCQRFYQQTLGQIKSQYVESGDVALIFRDLPLSFHEPAASLEANVAECVGRQGGDAAYFNMHDFIFENTATNGAGLSMDSMVNFANSLGLDGNAMRSCAEGGEFDAEIQADASAAASVGISGTPGFVVGVLNDDGTVTGEIVSGAQPFSVFQSTIEKYL